MRRILFAGSLALVTLSSACDQDESMSLNDLDRVDVQDVHENPENDALPDVFDPGLKSGVPTIGNKCRERFAMKEPQNGSGVEFDAECNTAYVLPPIVGTSKVGSFAPSQNLGFCEANNKVAGVSKSTMESAEKMAERLAKAGDKLDGLNEEVTEKKLELSRVTAVFESGQVQIPRIESKLENLRLDYKTAKRALDDCKLGASDVEAECKEQLNAAKAAKAALDTQRDELDKVELATSKAKVQKNQLEREIQLLEDKYNKGIQSHAEIQQLLFDLNASVMDLYKEYAVLEGAIGNIYYMVEWDKTVQAYRDANPEFKGSFRAMPLDDLRFDVRAHVGPSTTLPALLGVGVPGVGKLPTQASELVVDDMPVGTDPAPSAMASASVEKAVRGGHSNGANIALSLVGACPAYNPANDSIDTENLDGLLGAGISYSYQVQARRQYVASYSMKTWLEMMERIKKKTRPFTSKNLHKVASDAMHSEWFNIDFSANDAEFDYTPEEQGEIAKEVANSLQDNALKQLAHQMGILTPKVPKAKLTISGLQKWAKRKKKSCPWFFYCRVTEFSGKLLSDLWSNKKAVAKFKQSNAVWQTHRVRGTKMVRRYGSANFMPEQGPSKPSDDVHNHNLQVDRADAKDGDSDKDLS